MPTDDIGARIGRASNRWENILPRPFASRGGIFWRKRKRKPDLAESVLEIDAMQPAHALELRIEAAHDASRQHRHAILEALAIANHDFAAREIDVLRAQPDAFHDAHAGALEKTAEQPMDAAEAIEDAQHVVSRP